MRYIQLKNGLHAKFRWLNNPEIADVRRVCTKKHSVLKSENIVAYTGVISVEVEGTTVHFIYWDLKYLHQFINDVKKYSATYLNLAHEVVYDGECWGRSRGRGGNIINAVLQKTSPKIFTLLKTR